MPNSHEAIRRAGAPRPRFARGAGLLVLLSLAAAPALIPTAQTSALRLVSTAWPPFTNAPGQPRFALDLVETALGRIGLGSATTIVEAARFTPSLLSGTFDGSAAAWKDAERESALVFSRAYLENRLILVGRRDADVSAKQLADLDGKRIAIVAGYAYGEAIEKAGAVFVRSQSEEDSIALLLANKADYVLMDEIVVQYILDHHPEEARTRLTVGSTPLLIRPLYFAVRRSRPDADSIVKRFNEQLQGMIADRTYHRLLHVSWIRADMDGDGVTEVVPESDRLGTAAPQRAYLLFSDTQGPPSPAEKPSRFYLGGNIYTDWASVPNRYKVEDPQRPDPARSTGTIFRFTW
jgi:ABC-type amino acid transport substrate-binding protein